MRVTTPLALMACVVMTRAYDISNMTDSIYKVPITEDGLFDYAGAINLTPKGPKPPGSRMIRARARAVVRDNSAERNDDDDDDDAESYEEHEDWGAGDFDVPHKLEFGKSRCHKHFPHHHTRFLLGNTTMDFTHYPLTLAMFSTHSHILSCSYFTVPPQPIRHYVLTCSLPAPS